MPSIGIVIEEHFYLFLRVLLTDNVHQKLPFEIREQIFSEYLFLKCEISMLAKVQKYCAMLNYHQISCSGRLFNQ